MLVNDFSKSLCINRLFTSLSAAFRNSLFVLARLYFKLRIPHIYENILTSFILIDWIDAVVVCLSVLPKLLVVTVFNFWSILCHHLLVESLLGVQNFFHLHWTLVNCFACFRCPHMVNRISMLSAAPSTCNFVLILPCFFSRV